MRNLDIRRIDVPHDRKVCKNEIGAALLGILESNDPKKKKWLVKRITEEVEHII